MQIRILSKIRKYLSEEAAKSLTHAFVTFRLDNMNSLLHNLPNYQTKKLQFIQNHAARAVKKCKKSDNITQTLIDLHWLPVKFRLQYKLLILVYKCLHGDGPAYLSSLLEEYHPSRNLRSTAQACLYESLVHKRYGERAFSVAGPKLWNVLPESLRKSNSLHVFKKSLKTHIFKVAYDL